MKLHSTMLVLKDQISLFLSSPESLLLFQWNTAHYKNLIYSKILYKWWLHSTLLSSSWEGECFFTLKCWTESLKSLCVNIHKMWNPINVDLKESSLIIQFRKGLHDVGKTSSTSKVSYKYNWKVICQKHWNEATKKSIQPLFFAVSMLTAFWSCT